MKKITHVIWDWNGTLLNDISASLRAVNAMLEKRNSPPITLEKYRECIGVPISCFYQKVFDMEKENYDEILKEYNNLYEIFLEDCGLAHGAPEVMSSLCEKGIVQLILSSSEKNQLLRQAEKRNVLQHMNAVLGSDDFFSASKTERARSYFEKEGIVSKNVLIIGDLTHDYEMARELGCNCLLLTTGHHDSERLQKSGAKTISAVREILKYIKDA